MSQSSYVHLNLMSQCVSMYLQTDPQMGMLTPLNSGAPQAYQSELLTINGGSTGICREIRPSIAPQSPRGLGTDYQKVVWDRPLLVKKFCRLLSPPPAFHQAWRRGEIAVLSVAQLRAHSIVRSFRWSRPLV
jgi:hypothetical protein